MTPGLPVILQREPDNIFDNNAITVRSADELVLGHVPREIAARLAPMMDSGQPVSARLAVAAVVDKREVRFAPKIEIRYEDKNAENAD